VKHPRDTVQAPRFGSIAIGEVMPLREAARRMGWGQRMTADVQRMGLKTTTIGRLKYTTGRWVYDFVLATANKQAEGTR
jgi:hypothetical protein